jgi:1,4-dihydroxy-2-naphthoate octaprenyltransferase
MAQRAWAFVRLGRPHFLAGGFLLHALGAALAVQAGARFDAAVYLVGQVAVTAIQWMTHYANDYFDEAADRANRTPTAWSGGSRVLVSGELPPRVALATALALAALALVAALALASIYGRRVGVALILLALAWAWSYSGPPLWLARRGLGELTVALLVPGLTPAVGYALQRGDVAGMPWELVAPLCVLQFAMSLSINFPDAEGDRVSGKRTLLLRVGAQNAARLYMGAVAAGFVLLALAAVRYPAPGLLLAPLGLWLCLRMARGDWRVPGRWERLTFATIAMHVGTMALQTAGALAGALGWAG